MNKYNKIIILIVAILVLTGCSSKDYKLFQVHKSKVIERVSQKDYNKEKAYVNLISPNDRVDITVYVQAGQESQQMTSILSASMTGSSSGSETTGLLVSQEGNVILPLIGTMKIAKLSQEEAADFLITEYKKYIRNPYVLVEIKNQRIIVLGEVNKPGIVPILNGNMNLIEAIARSGDFTDYASRNDIVILRGDLRRPDVLNVNLSSLEAITLTSLILKPNDIVYVQPSSLKGINVAIKEILPITQLITNILLTNNLIKD